jgi:hypothetical protein
MHIYAHGILFYTAPAASEKSRKYQKVPSIMKFAILKTVLCMHMISGTSMPAVRLMVGHTRHVYKGRTPIR